MLDIFSLVILCIPDYNFKIYENYQSSKSNNKLTLFDLMPLNNKKKDGSKNVKKKKIFWQIFYAILAALVI